ncbi:hypothetical protein JL101_036510 (plasmid) [Skermanella rosea]|uniref:HGGxSTG domain-containing protein n=1 Tax=Skermanella rosea TaxID=1817965 RepID=UPI0019328E1E|nr:HGGxSTG domain-containing protein [Skermanella rosea]UEM08203.1 hypothetical protein JL101_036510 [Skermanella rosea]
METPLRRICGAKNRQGQPCQKRPLKGKNRCANHGGRTPERQNGGKSNGRYSHGLYSRHLQDDETAIWKDIPLGNIDDEIRIAKIWLARALELEGAIQKNANSPKNQAGFELVEFRQSTDDRGGKSLDTVSKRPDVSGRVNWLLGRIAQLEKTRGELLQVMKEANAPNVQFVVEAPVQMSPEEWQRVFGGRTIKPADGDASERVWPAPGDVRTDRPPDDDSDED